MGEIERLQDALEKFHSNPEGIYYIGQTLVHVDAFLERHGVSGAAGQLVEELMQELDDDERKEMGVFDPVISVTKVRALRRSLNGLKKTLVPTPTSKRKA